MVKPEWLLTEEGKAQDNALFMDMSAEGTEGGDVGGNDGGEEGGWVDEEDVDGDGDE